MPFIKRLCRIKKMTMTGSAHRKVAARFTPLVKVAPAIALVFKLRFCSIMVREYAFRSVI